MTSRQIAISDIQPFANSLTVNPINDTGVSQSLAQWTDVIDRQTRNITYSGTAFQSSNTFLNLAANVGGTATGSVHLGIMNIGSNTLALPSTSTINAWTVNHNCGGGNTQGGLVAMNAILNLNGSTKNVANSGYYTSSAVTAQASVNDNGTSIAPSGHIYAGNDNVRLISGATFWDQIVGREINVAVGTGASVSDKIGMQIVKTTADINKGSRVNSALIIGDQMDAATSGVGWLQGVCFGTYEGYNSIDPSGTLIGCYPHMNTGNLGTVNIGVDFSLYTFTTAFLKSNNFLVDGSGNVTANTVKLAAFTVSTLPAQNAGALIYVSNGTANKRLAISDGTNWRFPDGNIVS